MEVLVFKTNIRSERNTREVIPHLNQLKGIIKWNIDFHDKDKVLRIVSHNLSPHLVEHALQRAGYVL